MATPELIPVKELARRNGRDYRQLLAAVRSGYIPSVVIRARPLVLADALETFDRKVRAMRSTPLIAAYTPNRRKKEEREELGASA
jgi:hypothetical protein